MGSGLSKRGGSSKSGAITAHNGGAYPRASILNVSGGGPVPSAPTPAGGPPASGGSAASAPGAGSPSLGLALQRRGSVASRDDDDADENSSPAAEDPTSNDDANDGSGNVLSPSAGSAGSQVSPTSYESPPGPGFSGGPPGHSGRGSATEKLQKVVDVDDAIQRLLDAGSTGKVSKNVCLKNSEIAAICNAAREIFLSQPALIEISPPVKIVGDVHGQYTDLLRLFDMCGFPPFANFLFLGDYVDRGKQSLETILLLLSYKIKYPENFFLLRGNHECANVTRVYGFYDECKRRTTIKMWKMFVDVFNTLPIAAVVAGKIFCVHGGLSPSLNSMDDIRAVERPTDVPDFGLLNDLLWSDPSETATDWEDNERGVSYCFGRTIIEDFLRRHDFDLVCRAHMVVEDGYEFFDNRSLVTVFSAPNYCGEFDNFGAVMCVGEDLLCSFELLKPLELASHKGGKGPLGGGRRRPSPPMMGMANQQAAAAAAREARQASKG